MPPLLSLVLADTELELVPEAIQSHPSVRAPARRAGSRPSRGLLDSSLHHSAMRQLPEGERRGRPDIAHLFLLSTLDSILNLEGGLRVFVHTRNDELLTVDPKTRIMRNYNRFLGLLEQVFREGRAPPTGEPLLQLERGVPLAEAVKRTGAQVSIVFDEAGAREPLSDLLRPHAAAGKHVVCILGGFPKGGYKSATDFASHRVSIYEKPLSAWVVAAEAIVRWEDAAARSREPGGER